MGKRKGLSPTLRWAVFARDGSSWRNCGRSAGEDGIDLVVDHVVSVKDDGPTSMDNLATACRGCNAGKSARSLQSAPTTGAVVKRIKRRASNLLRQAAAIREAMEASKEAAQEAVNLKCAAYEIESANFAPGEKTIISNLCWEFGADKVLEWYQIAAGRSISEWAAVQS